MEYVFKSERGLCPQCIAFGKVYFIQDRYIGGEKYEYALMSRELTKKTRVFDDVKKMVNSLIGSEITDDIAINLLLSQMTVCQNGSYQMLEYDGATYVWDNENKVLKEYIEPKQETGYCNTYLECLNMAKEILQQKERECIGVQLSLLDCN